MPEFRWNPLLGTWMMMASNRQKRPTLQKGVCPFCPGSGKVPEQYDVLKYDNDFPVMTQAPEQPIAEADLLKNAPAYGKCEVILYTSDHHKHFWQLDLAQIEKVLKLWQERTVELIADPKIKYVYIFENRGEEVGVTMHHPHGQLYAYGFLPLKPSLKLDNCKAHYEQYGESLVNKLIAAEVKEKSRIVHETDSFIAFIPYFNDYPYGVTIYPKGNQQLVSDFSTAEIRDLANMLKTITGSFDCLFDKPFPYMMCVQQAAVNVAAHTEAEKYYKFHIEFYPPLRSADKIKWNASSETGAWAAANPRDLKETAKELRAAIVKYGNSFSRESSG